MKRLFLLIVALLSSIKCDVGFNIYSSNERSHLIIDHTNNVAEYIEGSELQYDRICENQLDNNILMRFSINCDIRKYRYLNFNIFTGWLPTYSLMNKDDYTKYDKYKIPIQTRSGDTTITISNVRYIKFTNKNISYDDLNISLSYVFRFEYFDLLITCLTFTKEHQMIFNLWPKLWITDTDYHTEMLSQIIGSSFKIKINITRLLRRGLSSLCPHGRVYLTLGIDQVRISVARNSFRGNHKDLYPF